MRTKITRYGITLVFLLTFFQQIGAGLFIHNLAHDKGESKEVPSRDEAKKEISFACSCVDDFLAPFEHADDMPALQAPVIYPVYSDVYTGRAYFTSLYFSSLRGPPAQIG